MAKSRSLADDVRAASWASEAEREAFIDQCIREGGIPIKPLAAAFRDAARDTDARRVEDMMRVSYAVLEQTGTAEHIPVLAPILGSSASPIVRRYLVAILAKLPVREQLGSVLDLLRGDDADARMAGAEVLTRIGGKTIFDGLGRALLDGSWSTRKDGIDALVKIGTYHAIPVLTTFLQQGEKPEQLLALKYLSDMSIMKARRRQAVEALRSGSETDDLDLRMRIAGAMGDVGTEEDAPFLVEILGEADRRYQQHIIRSLGRLKAKASIPALLPFMRSTYVGLRIETIQALASFEDEEVIEHMIEALRDDELLVRQKAIEVLAELGKSPNVRLGRMLVLMMRDKDVNVRRAVIEVIRAIGGEEERDAWAKLVRYLKDEDWWVRESVTDVLTEVGGRDIVEPILALLSDASPVVRRYALEVIVRLKERSAAAHLARATRDPDWWVRERAIEALAALQIKEAVPHLIRLMEEDPELRWVVVKGLGELKDGRALPALLSLLALRDTTGDFRLELLSAIESIGKREVAPQLQEALADPDQRVRHRARQILQRFHVEVSEEETNRLSYRDLSFVDRLLMEVRDRGGHDLFILAGQPPLIKLAGDVRPLRDEPLDDEAIDKILVDVMTPVQHETFLGGDDVDFSYTVKGLGGRFRVNAYRQWTGFAAVFRVIANEIMTLDQLKLAPVIREFCNLRSGLVLVTGPTGSGKSTTLAAMIDHMNRHRTEHIITVEDPIEYVHPNRSCVINQREIGVHTLNYAEALRGALRQDPDVILVGEMRDHETMSTAITAAETGHLVLGTLHTASAAKTVNRIIDVFPPSYHAQVRTMISESLKAVLSQHLIPRVDQAGKLALAMEIMICNEAIANVIRKEKSYQIPSMLATTAEIGNQLMDNELLKLVKQGIIDPEEGYAKAENKREFESYLPAPIDVERELEEKLAARRSASAPRQHLRAVGEVAAPGRSGANPGRAGRPEAEDAVARIDSFLMLVKEQRASDLHLCVGQPPIIRFAGDLVPIKFRMLTDFELKRMVYETLRPAQIAFFEENMDLDFAYSIDGVARYRGHLFYDENGIGAAYRIIPEHIESIDELRLPTSLKKLSRFDKGLILVTGATGSGKSTTLAAILNEINETRQKHIITVEDPIEFIHQPKKCVFSHREVGTHTKSFQSALRSCLREAPDVILIGEMRDIETISLALTCAETGALVFGTLHTQSASKTVDRIIDVFPAEQQEQIRSMLSLNLKGVMCQNLLKTSDETNRCAAVEILFGSTALSNLIRDNKTYQIDTLIQLGGYEKTGMQTMDQALVALCDEGRVNPQEARRFVRDPGSLGRFFQEALSPA